MAQDPIQHLIEQDRHRRQAEHLVNQALQGALQAPHSIEVVQTSMMNLQTTTDGGTVLMIATPDGRRRDIMLSPQVIASIAQIADESSDVAKAA